MVAEIPLLRNVLQQVAGNSYVFGAAVDQPAIRYRHHLADVWIHTLTLATMASILHSLRTGEQLEVLVWTATPLAQLMQGVRDEWDLESRVHTYGTMQYAEVVDTLGEELDAFRAQSAPGPTQAEFDLLAARVEDLAARLEAYGLVDGYSGSSLVGRIDRIEGDLGVPVGAGASDVRQRLDALPAPLWACPPDWEWERAEAAFSDEQHAALVELADDRAHYESIEWWALSIVERLTAGTIPNLTSTLLSVLWNARERIFGGLGRLWALVAETPDDAERFVGTVSLANRNFAQLLREPEELFAATLRGADDYTRRQEATAWLERLNALAEESGKAP